jgi:hemoglobin/transferrin/lactoferrin receptor protein
VAAFGSSIAVQQAIAQSGQTVRLSIPAQPLASAIDAFSRATGWQVGYSSQLARSTTHAVSGVMSPGQALQAMLSGTGISIRMTGPSSAALVDPATANSDQAPPNDGSLLLQTIDVTGLRGSGFTADTPFETPGSVSHISRQQLDRIPPSSAGDVFINAPGVLSAGNRVGASIQPNIRGLQGYGRVSVTVDGARQTSTSYRGYSGNRDETFIDVDMIGGVDITKGPDSKAGGAGAIGGTVAFRTLDAQDIVKDGKQFGVRLKGSLGNNTINPVIDSSVRHERPGFFEGDTWSGSAAAAVVHENFEAVAAYSKRKQGNYFVGNRLQPGTVVPPGIDGDGDGRVMPGWYSPLDRVPNIFLMPGSEAFNTSLDNESVLLKGKLKWGDGFSFELGYLRFDSRHGELDEFNFGLITTDRQTYLTKTRVDTRTAKFRWNPTDNDLINFRANAWWTDLNNDRGADNPLRDDRDNHVKTRGWDVGNTFVLDAGGSKFALDIGLEAVNEEAAAPVFIQLAAGGGPAAYGPIGTRSLSGVFTNAKFDLTEWLTVMAGLRHDRFEASGEEPNGKKFENRDGSRTSPNYGVTLTPVAGLQLFALYKEGYRPPTLREMYWRFQNLLGPNPNLLPEISKNKEYGFNILRDDVFAAGDKLRFKAAYFDNRYDDYVYRGRPPGSLGSSGYTWLNIDHANFRGFELSASYDVGRFFLEGNFTKYTRIEYCDGNAPCYVPAMGGFASSTDASRNDYLTNYIPPTHHGSLTAGLRFFDQKLTLGGRVHFASTRFGTRWSDSIGVLGEAGVNFTWPSYRAYDVFASYKFTEDAILNLSVENLTDEYYFSALAGEGLPSPGRTARASLTFRF